MTELSANILSLDLSRTILASALHGVLAKMQTGSQSAILNQDWLYLNLARPPESHLGDFALPCFRLAKELRLKPVELAAAIAIALPSANPQWIEKVEAAGPFLNITLRPAALAVALVPALRDGSYFAKLKMSNQAASHVMIEYSQPNTHKAFHVGHMRNVALGDALGRLYAACGYPVTMANYIGDEGAHVAKCLWFMQTLKEPWPKDRLGEWLGDIYAQATLKLESASSEQLPLYLAEISAVLRAIESKQGSSYELWRQTRQWSIEDFEQIYHWIGARFDHWFWESEVSEESQKIVDDYLERGVFAHSEGAVGLDLKDEKLGFVILRKSDGNTTYATKDLALAQVKYRKFNVKKSIYVVGSEQILHFRQVFRTLEKMGFSEAQDCFHLSYGMVVLPDGKMSSRKGNVIKFRELKEKLEEELDKKLAKYKEEWTEAELIETRSRLSVGAIRYGMICSDPIKDIVFDLKDWLSFEGNTGPYLMYSYARTRSILRKAAEQGFLPATNLGPLLGTAEERELLRYLNDLNGTIEQSCLQNKPSLLCHHIFNTCKVYNRLLAQVPILKAESSELRSARLALLDAFSVSLKYGLSLLGLEPPERM